MTHTPDVSILIANRDGRHHLEACLPSLLEQDYPQGHTEIVVMDDTSSDDSVAWVRKNYPHVRLMINPHNLGFAPTNNKGVREAEGELVVLLNNDTKAKPGWLSALVKAWQTDPDHIAAVGSKMLNWEGDVTAFYGGEVNFVGKGFELWCPVDSADDPKEPYDMLFPCAGAALYHRQTWLDVGGFDDQYIMTYEDVDVGWRLNLLGYRCVYEPASVVHHQTRGWLSSIDYGRRAPFLERNALATIFKNYDDEAFHRILPVALLLAIKRSRLLGWHADMGWSGSRSWFDEVFGGGGEPDAFHDDGLHHLAALDRFVDGMPHLWERRREIQERRTVSDEEIFRKFFPNPFKPWALNPEHEERLQRGRYGETMERLVELFGIRKLFDA